MIVTDNEQPVEFSGDLTPAPKVSDPMRVSPSSTMTGVWDFDGYAVSINPAYQVALGWSVEELSSVPYWELLHPDDQDRSVEARQRMLLSGPGHVFGHEVRMLRRDGTYRRIRWDLRSDLQEQLIYLVGVDISDHEPMVTGKRVLVGSWDWHIPTDTVTLSGGMFEIYQIPAGPAEHLRTALQRLSVGDRPPFNAAEMARIGQVWPTGDASGRLSGSSMLGASDDGVHSRRYHHQPRRCGWNSQIPAMRGRQTARTSHTRSSATARSTSPGRWTGAGASTSGGSCPGCGRGSRALRPSGG